MPVPRVSSLCLVFITLLAAMPTLHAADTKDTAASALDRVNAQLTATPKDLQAMFMRGVMLAEQNRREEAIKAFTEITEKYPNLPEPYNNLAVLYADQGQFDKARKALESAIKTHPSYATAHENLGDIYAKMASEAYDKALQLDTSNTRAQSKLSLIKEIFVTGSKPPAPKLADASPEPAKPAAPAITPALPAPKPEALSAPASRAPETKADTKSVEPKPAEAKPNANKPAEAVSIASSKAVAEAPPAGDIANAVMQWAKAWSGKDINRYLESYAGSFQAPDGLSRKDWEQSRRQRINKPAAISVDITNLKVTQDGNSAKASFKQSYRSGSIAQRTNKTLNLVKVNNKWLIEQEITDR